MIFLEKQHMAQQPVLLLQMEWQVQNVNMTAAGEALQPVEQVQ
jgi:hypothetical protein